MRQRLVGLTTSYPLRPDGCAGVFIRNLYRNLPSDWEVDVVCPDDDKKISDNYVDYPFVRRVRYAPRSSQLLAQQSGGLVSGLRHAPWRILLLPALFIAMTWQCARYARQAKLIHANWAVCGAIAVLVGRTLGVPVVTTLRGDDVTRASHSLLERWVLGMAVRGSQRIVCVSTAMSAQLKAKYPKLAQRIFTCHNGVDEAFFKVSRTSKTSKHIRVVAVGSLISRKGYEVLIDAVAAMRNPGAIKVTIAGDGPLKGSLQERMVVKGVAERFELIGEISPENMPALLADADVFVLVSRSEGRPNVVVEALAAGLPVISTKLPGVEGLVEDGFNGWLVGVDDSSAVASALQHAAADAKERLRRGNAARDGMIKLGQTWSATGARYSQIFHEASFEKDRMKS